MNVSGRGISKKIYSRLFYCYVYFSENHLNRFVLSFQKNINMLAILLGRLQGERFNEIEQRDEHDKGRTE